MKTLGETLGNKYVTVVALGDSITAVNHWTMGGLNWVGLLQCGLFTCFPKGYTVINSGIGGDNAIAGKNRYERDVLRFNPDLVIISFGMNDAGNPEGIPAFMTAMREMIGRAREHCGSQILLRTPNPIISMNDGTEMVEFEMNGGRCRYEVEKYAGAIVQLASEEKTWLVDHYSLWKKSLATRYHGEMCMLMGNSMHPNAHGHRRFYHELAPVFGSDTRFQHEWEHILEINT